MGITDGRTKEKKSYLDTLRKFPMRLRGKSETMRADTNMERQGSNPALKSPYQAPAPKSGLKNDNDFENDMEDMDTNTVAPGQQKPSEKPANKKLVVHATSSRTDGGTGGKGEAIPESEAPRLVYMTSYGSKVTYPLVWEETTIGRKDDNQIVLTDATISKCHASVLRKPDGYRYLI